MRHLIPLGLVLSMIAVNAHADEWPESFAREGECAVCTVRGANHGNEEFVAFRTLDDAHYGFCSDGCAQAFDQMPGGYTPPVLPRPAPGFEWTALDGASITPTGQRALLVDFWATWCTPCIAAMPELEELARNFADDGLRIVGVSIDEERAKVDAFLAKRPLDYPVVHDGGEDPAWWQFQVPVIPAAYLLDGEGNVVAQWRSAFDEDEVRAQVESLLGSE